MIIESIHLVMHKWSGVWHYRSLHSNFPTFSDGIAAVLQALSEGTVAEGVSTARVIIVHMRIQGQLGSGDVCVHGENLPLWASVLDILVRLPDVLLKFIDKVGDVAAATTLT